MSFYVGLTKLVAVVHVESLGTVDQTSPQLMDHTFWLRCSTLDVCRQLLAKTESFGIKVTKDAVDDGGGGSWDFLTLVPDLTFSVVSKLACIYCQETHVSNFSG